MTTMSWHIFYLTNHDTMSRHILKILIQIIKMLGNHDTMSQHIFSAFRSASLLPASASPLLPGTTTSSVGDCKNKKLKQNSKFEVL